MCLRGVEGRPGGKVNNHPIAVEIIGIFQTRSFIYLSLLAGN